MNFFQRCSCMGFTLPQRLKPTPFHHLRNTTGRPKQSNQMSGQFTTTGSRNLSCLQFTTTGSRNLSCLQFTTTGSRNLSCLQIAQKPFLQNLRTADQSSVFSFVGLQSIRCKARGNEYQPNVRKRLTKHGYHKRMKTISGMEILWRRMLKGRTLLVHGNFNRKPFRGV